MLFVSSNSGMGGGRGQGFCTHVQSRAREAWYVRGLVRVLYMTDMACVRLGAVHVRPVLHAVLWFGGKGHGRITLQAHLLCDASIACCGEAVCSVSGRVV